MTSAIVPSANETWRFRGTGHQNGYRRDMVSEAARNPLATAFDPTPEQMRELLDARFARHPADDLNFIPGGPVSRRASENHIMACLADRCRRNRSEQAVREAGGS